MGIEEWSTYAEGNNRGSPPSWAPENLTRVTDWTDITREHQAAIRRWYEDAQWILTYPNGAENPEPVTVDWVDANTFRLNGIDATDTYEVDRRVRAVGTLTGTVYGVITSSTYTAGNTTVVATWSPPGPLADEALVTSVHILSTKELEDFAQNPSDVPLVVAPPSGEAYFRVETAVGSGEDPRFETYRGQSASGSRFAQIRSTGVAWYFEVGDDAGGSLVPASVYAGPLYDSGNRVHSDANPPDTGGSAVPVGTILEYAGTGFPSGGYWIECLGTSLLVDDYPALFAAIGYTYGGSGISFNVPDTRDHALAGAGTYAVGTKYGSQFVQLTGDESGVAAHSHTATVSPAGAAGRVAGGNTGNEGDGWSQPTAISVSIDAASAPAASVHQNEGRRMTMRHLIRRS